MGDDGMDALDLSIAYELMDDDEEIDAKAGPDWQHGRRPLFKTCNRCGAGDLLWEETDDGWRLADNKGLHVCSRLDPILLRSTVRS